MKLKEGSDGGRRGGGSRIDEYLPQNFV